MNKQNKITDQMLENVRIICMERPVLAGYLVAVIAATYVLVIIFNADGWQA